MSPSNSFDKDKFETVLLYIIRRCQNIPSFGKTVLFKLLYFSDFDFYELKRNSITGESYRKIDHGPAPCHFDMIVKKLKTNGKIKEVKGTYCGSTQIKFIPFTEPDLSVLSAEELNTINDVIIKLSHMTANKISKFSHNDMPWAATKDKEIINYDLVFYRTPVYSVTKEC